MREVLGARFTIHAGECNFVVQVPSEGDWGLPHSTWQFAAEIATPTIRTPESSVEVTPLLRAIIEPRADLDPAFRIEGTDDGSFVLLRRETIEAEIDRPTLYASGGALLLAAELAGSEGSDVEIWAVTEVTLDTDQALVDALAQTYQLERSEADNGLVATAEALRLNRVEYGSVFRQLVDLARHERQEFEP